MHLSQYHTEIYPLWDDTGISPTTIIGQHDLYSWNNPEEDDLPGSAYRFCCVAFICSFTPYFGTKEEVDKFL